MRASGSTGRRRARKIGAMLLGREAECARLDSLVANARAGRSSALVLCGEAGVGKTALLAYAEERAAGFRILSARGVESESELAFGALNDLLRPILDKLPSLPAPQTAALASALAIGPPVSADRFATCAATLSLLATAADDAPLLALVDDAQWLDASSAQAIVFAARRLESEGTVLLFSARDREAPVLEAGGLPMLRLNGLDAEAARALLDEYAPSQLGAAVADRLVEATAGNPLALIEIPVLLSTAQLAGAEPLDEMLPPAPTVTRAFRRRLHGLPEKTRQALLVVSASHSGELETIEPALAALGLDLHALDDAEEAGLVRVNAYAELSHPLLRSTIYHAGTAADRRAAHRALAEAERADRRAWHLAAAAPHADENAARALEETARTTRARGGYGEAASAFERAAELTDEPSERVRRLREAANDFRFVGRFEQGLRLLDQALRATEDPVTRARIQHLRGVIEMWHGSARQAFWFLTAEAERIEPTDRARAARMLTDAAWAAFMAGEVTAGLERAERACTLSRGVGGATEILAQAVLGVALTLGGEASRALELFADQAERLDELSSEQPWQLGRPVGQVMMWFERYADARVTLTRAVETGRARSALGALPFSLAGLSELEFRTGDWDAAYADAAEGARIAEDTLQTSGLSYALICLAQVEAGRGREDACREHLDSVLEISGGRVGAAVALAGSVLGFLELGLGRTDRVIAGLRRLAQQVAEQGLREPCVIQWAPNLVEAYVRAGRRGEAERELETFEAQAKRTERTWALASAARCRGLLAADDAFEPFFEQALTRHAASPTPFDRARTELCFGERLRRARRRAQARELLRSALSTFERLGAEPWSERARHELAATGETVRRREPITAEQLTPTELQVARIVARGATNKEAGAALFLSPKTIETHLGRVYRKLNVRSRTELAHMLASA
jgi:DNA-binding CsgD family transcriptional regulator/tetratricopeptide (TPR) repeat protein